MSTFKNYTIIRSIGKGGMSEVFLAEDNRFNTKVAIKVLNREFSSNSNISKRFIAEARNLFRMSHPNIVRVTDLIEEDGKKAFVMEFIEGNNLRDEVEKLKTLNSEVIGAFLSQMLSALGYCHSEGLVHRDIKPSNFMITSKGQIKLLDFGIAKNTENRSEYTQTGTSHKMGTPLYMSPEQILETKSVDFRTDIYSLGVVLWQLVTGKKPYDSKSMSAFQIQLNIVKDALPVTGSEFDEIIQKCTAKDPKDRFQSCKEIQISCDRLIHKKGINSSEEDTLISINLSANKKKKLVDLRRDLLATYSVRKSSFSRIPRKSYPKDLLFILLGFLVLLIFLISFYFLRRSSLSGAETIEGEKNNYDPEMILVNGGKFSMLGTNNTAPRNANFKSEMVQLSAFYISKFEVTQKLWKAVMGYNPSINSSCYDCPVENVSWNEAQDFIKELNLKTGKNYRLPTEAEWEYAARGGNKNSGSIYSGSNEISAVAWHKNNSDGRTHEVGKKQPNVLGLYDMSGNVWEWCLDNYSYYSSIINLTNPINTRESLSRSLRGGSYNEYDVKLRLGFRTGNTPDSRSADRGFRLVLISK